MRLGLIGDTHLGANYSIGKSADGQYINSRLIDYRATLEKTIDAMADGRVRHLIFTGDIFESRSPSLVQQKVFSEALHHALTRDIAEIHIVVGNHDLTRLAQANTLSYLKELNLPNIHVYDEITAVELQDDSGKTVANLVALPFRDRKWYGLESYNDAIAQIRKEFDYALASIENQLPRIVIPHMAIEGTFIGQDDESLELYGENQLFLPKAMFEKCDLVVGGHIHEPMVLQQAGPYIAYVGSMEKRSASEKHDKLYAFIDAEALTVEYQKEPCREIYEVKLDYSYEVLGEELEKRICADIDEFADAMGIGALEDSIFKVGLKICAADDKYVHPKQLYRFLKEKHKVHNCCEIRPEIFSARQARNDKITEQVSDTEAFKLHLETAIEDQSLRAEVLELGLEIIKLVEQEEAV